MNVLDIILGVVTVILCVIVVVLVLMQQGKRTGVSSAVAGGSESFISGSKSRTKDANLKRFTRYAAIVLMLLLVGINIYAFFR